MTAMDYASLAGEFLRGVEQHLDLALEHAVALPGAEGERARTRLDEGRAAAVKLRVALLEAKGALLALGAKP